MNANTRPGTSGRFLFFGAIVLVGYLLEKKGIDILEITLKEAVVIILASYRMTRILVFERYSSIFGIC